MPAPAWGSGRRYGHSNTDDGYLPLYSLIPVQSPVQSDAAAVRQKAAVRFDKNLHYYLPEREKYSSIKAQRSDNYYVVLDPDIGARCWLYRHAGSIVCQYKEK